MTDSPDRYCFCGEDFIVTVTDGDKQVPMCPEHFGMYLEEVRRKLDEIAAMPAATSESEEN